jgi:hypothetical protein
VLSIVKPVATTLGTEKEVDATGNDGFGAVLTNTALLSK